jgi:hypothetical protein
MDKLYVEEGVGLNSSVQIQEPSERAQNGTKVKFSSPHHHWVRRRAGECWYQNFLLHSHRDKQFDTHLNMVSHTKGSPRG